jgi:hypothetical protein
MPRANDACAVSGGVEMCQRASVQGTGLGVVGYSSTASRGFYLV